MIIRAIRTIVALAITALWLLNTDDVAALAADKTGFPRIMSMNIGAKNYDDATYIESLSRPHVVILGFYPGWKGKDGKATMETVIRAIKQRNPNSLIGQYTILSETQDSTDPASADTDRGKKLDREGWWLLNAKGKRVQWTDKYTAYEANITQWTTPDQNGQRYPEWLAGRDYKIYFQTTPGFDIWYFDNALSKPAVKSADWNRDGSNDANDSSEILTAHRSGHVAEWRKARELRPDIFLMGNSDDLSSLEFSGKLQGAFLEGMIGVSWSMERWQGWEKMIARYHSAMIHTASPHLVGFNVWGRADDYRQMRYGLTSCLLDDGYFSYTDPKAGYSSVPWFDEFDVNLGDPVDPVQTKPWEQGVYRRVFQHGLILVNPGALPRTVRLNPGYRHFDGTQAREVNNGKSVTSITIPPKDGIVLIRVDR